MLPCLFKSILGIECLGCGVQRSALLIFSGNWVKGLHQYPSIIPLIILLSTLIIGFIHKNKKLKVFNRYFAIFTFICIVLSYLIKHVG